jgi:hypothetical protein
LPWLAPLLTGVKVPATRYMLGMVVYGVVDSRDEAVVEFFTDPEVAEMFIADIRGDEPEFAALLRVEGVEFEVALS